MTVKLVDATVSSFDAAFDKFRSEAPKHRANLILFLADKDPSTSLSWCPEFDVGLYTFILLRAMRMGWGRESQCLLPYCVRAEPVIYKKLEVSSDDVVLLRAYVGDRPTWRNPQHPWRTDPRFKLVGVPTLIRWENDAIKGRLEDNEAHLEHKISALISGE
ncbi:thioredoxin-like protein Clot isoform X1 [Punica granatum]|uniref:Thioredoxin-like protein Clot isoform X1 n=1 Tax=Punica granatum TaxID=22663 RepID=A0A6P8DMI1_PUNGR|nr:thioredoxin-like protein Clot isoform X1 [Punica granatum]